MQKEFNGISPIQVAKYGENSFTIPELDFAKKLFYIDCTIYREDTNYYEMKVYKAADRISAVLFKVNVNLQGVELFSTELEYVADLTYFYGDLSMVYDNGMSSTLTQIENEGKTVIHQKQYLYIVLAGFIKDSNPYAFKVIQDNDLKFLTKKSCTNIIQICAGHLNEFERCLKCNPHIVLSIFHKENWDDILLIASPSNMPTSVKTWIEKLNLSQNQKDLLTDFMSRITNLEDGNNAVIMMDYLKAVLRHQINKKNLYVDQCAFMKMVENIKYLISDVPKEITDYKSKDVVEYAIRQNFYHNRVGLPREEISQLADYVSMGVNNNLPFEKYPNNIFKAHNYMVHNVGCIKAPKDICEKFVKQVETWGNYEVSFEDYVVVIPKEPKDLTMEGTALRHCVGNYIYGIAQGRKIIAFLRKKESIETPYVTIEIKNGKVVEAKKIFNDDVDNETWRVLREIEKLWKGNVK